MTIKMLTLEDLELKDKTVFVRIDVNTPVVTEVSKLASHARFAEAAATIRDLSESRVVAASHQGRVGRPDYTGLGLHARALSEALGKEVKFVDDVVGPAALAAMDALQPGEVLLLDNLRFTAEENVEYKPIDAEKTHLVSRIRGHIQACVLDAFSTGHRASPSIVGFAELVPTCAGRTLGPELRKLDRIISVEKAPYVAVMGGTKVGDRMEAIDALVANGRADKVLLGGLVGLVFLKAVGKYRGQIKVDDEQKQLLKARQLWDEDQERYELPTDLAVSIGGERKELDSEDVPGQLSAFDVGRKTVERYSRLVKGAGTVFMTGPPGAFEVDGFSYGTEGILEALSSSLGTTIASGGELSAALRRFGAHDQVDHVSTAGGALVQYLAGKRLPLIDALERSANKWGPKKDMSDLWSSVVTLKEGLGSQEL